MIFSPVVLLAFLLGLMAGAFALYFLRAPVQRQALDELRRLQDEQQRWQDEQRRWQEKLQAQAVEIARQQERVAGFADRDQLAHQQQERWEEERRQLERAVRERDARLAETETRLQAEREQIDEKRRFVMEQEQALKLQFEQLAARIFEEKTRVFSEQSRSGLDGLLNPLREQLKDFREKVENTYNNEARERFALKEQIGRLEGLNRQISDDASNLARALKGDKKLQGNWGEIILARVLEESGLREGHEYLTQFSARDDEGRRRVPDAIVRLPENRDIIIDSKVSLNDYVLYCAAEDPAERERLLKAHAAALRHHIKILSEKRYEDLPELRTLDFVFLFMPVEAAFMLAVEQDPALFREAFNHKIIIVSPTTLLATLRTVESIWRYERQNQNAEKIAKEAGGLHDKFVTLIGHLEDLGRAIERSREGYQKTLGSLTGHGGLMGRVENLRKLGAKTKKSLDKTTRLTAEDNAADAEADTAADTDAADDESAAES